MKIKKVAIIILNWNGLENTINCLNYLFKIKDKNFKVFLIDNGSKNNEAEKLKNKFKKKIIVLPLNKNVGYGAGVNIGIKKSSEKYDPDYFLLLNNDTVVNPDFLTHLIYKAETDKNIGIVGPIIFNYFNKEKILSAGGEMNWLLSKPYHRKIHKKSENSEFYVTGAAMLIKKTVINQIGYLDDHFFAYFEDTAYCMKARKSGFKIFCEPKAKVYHMHSASTGKESPFNTYLMSRNRILFVNKYLPFFYRIYFVLFNFIKTSAVLIYFNLQNQKTRASAFYKGFIDGNKGIGGFQKI